MAHLKDPRGILTFIIRYLLLTVLFLVGLPASRGADLALFYFFGFTGLFTFFQVLASISPKFLIRAGGWKPVVIAGAVGSDTVVLWWLGHVVAKLFGSGSDWLLVTEWLPFHFLAAGLAWGLREIIHAVRSRGTATSRNSGSPVESGQSEASSGSEGLYTQTGEPASTDADTDNR